MDSLLFPQKQAPLNKRRFCFIDTASVNYMMVSRYAVISASVVIAITFSATASASAFVHFEMFFLTLRTDGAETLNSVSPNEISSGIISGFAAASPHIPTGIFSAAAQRIILRIMRRTLGCIGEYR